AAFVALAAVVNKPVKGDILWLLPLLMIFAGLVAVRANFLLTALNILGCVLLILLIIEVYVRGSVREFLPEDYLKLIFPYKWVDPLIQSCADVLSLRKKVSEQKRATEITRGILITLPVI